MNIIQKCSEDEFADEYVLLSKESVQRLVDKSARTNDDKTQKIIIQLSKWIYENNLIEDEEYNFLGYGSGTTVTGSVLFKLFVDMLYNMRMEHKNNDFKKNTEFSLG